MSNGSIDVHTLETKEGLDLDRVGVRGIRYPISVLDKDAGAQQTVGKVDMFVNLPRRFKGAHMSRFLEVLNVHKGEIGIRALPAMLRAIQDRLCAESAHIEIEFPYFIEKLAPVTRSPGMMSYTCRILGRADEKGVDIGLEVQVPIMTLCPCSKELSERGPHNQRGTVTARVRFEKLVWIEDLVHTIEACASSDLYTLLKRADEKFVADAAYENPQFVEDVARGVGVALLQDENITWFRVEVETLESIHSHNAYASIERGEVRP